ncbi:MAG: UvrD-helicase domain-containing protein [Chlamydiales bacterium]|nr:UvrD-helicase domain-containing protein [Chlamydiales bacterium]
MGLKAVISYHRFKNLSFGGMDFLEQLNSQQRVATTHIEGPLLVLAGAGSGKTRVVTCRIAHLLKIGVLSSEILAVTFTNKAAHEMRQRIFYLTQETILSCTFHSLCARILRESISYLNYRSDFTIYDEEDSEKVIRECLKTFGLKENKATLKTLKTQISQAKNALTHPEGIPLDEKPLCQIYKMYQQKLKEYNALDFDDLLYLTVSLLKSNHQVLSIYQKRWSFILIDEYQDTNTAQYIFIRLLAACHNNIFAVGDPDQSIYSWRGANVHNILNFKKDFPEAKIIALEENYRSHSLILKAANSLIQHNKSRYPKNLWSKRTEGEKITLYLADTEYEEARFVVSQIQKLHIDQKMCLNECAIFFRTHFQSRLFEDYLLKEHIPYVIVGGISFYQRKEIKDLLAWLRMTLASTDFIAFSRTINLPKRGLGDITLQKLREVIEKYKMDILTCIQGILNDQIPCKLSNKQLQGLKEYTDLILSLQKSALQKTKLSLLIEQVIHQSHYLDYLCEDPDSYQDRKGNIEELITKATEWEEENKGASLTQFLEELTLKSVPETLEENHCIRLMTLHNGKGLEFSCVFMVGLEEELLPHINVIGHSDALEEERRLCYVGMTRAKDLLFLTAARQRHLWGLVKTMRPSRFLSEIPSTFIQMPSKKPIETHSHQQTEKGHFQEGDRVFHKDFGLGIIQKQYNTSLGMTYDVFFLQSKKLRSLVAKYAKLFPAD